MMGARKSSCCWQFNNSRPRIELAQILASACFEDEAGKNDLHVLKVFHPILFPSRVNSRIRTRGNHVSERSSGLFMDSLAVT